MTGPTGDRPSHGHEVSVRLVVDAYREGGIPEDVGQVQSHTISRRVSGAVGALPYVLYTSTRRAIKKQRAIERTHVVATPYDDAVILRSFVPVREEHHRPTISSIL